MNDTTPNWLKREMEKPFFFADVSLDYIKERLTWTSEARRMELLLWKAGWVKEVPLKSHKYRELESKYREATTDDEKEELLYELVCLLNRAIQEVD